MSPHSYPVCVQLCLHCRDVAPYRRLLLQLLTFKPQPVQELLQRHVEPLPWGHLWVQVGPSNTNTLGQLFPPFPLEDPSQPLLTSCWGSCCAGRSSAGSCCPDVSGAEWRPPSPPARSQSSGHSHPGSDRAQCGRRSLPEGPGNKHTARVSGKSFSVLWISHFIFLVTVCSNGIRMWEQKPPGLSHNAKHNVSWMKPFVVLKCQDVPFSLESVGNSHSHSGAPPVKSITENVPDETPDGTKYLKHNLKQENTSCLGAVQKIPEEMWCQSLLQIKVRWAQGVPLFLHWGANDQTLKQLLFKRFCPTTSEWQLCSHLVQQLVVRHQKAFSKRTKCPQRGKHFKRNF